MQNLAVVRFDANGEIIDHINYFDYKRGDGRFSTYLYGKSLLDILQKENRINENLQLNYILSSNNKDTDLTRILGNVAEALIVDACNKYPDINRELARIARSGNKSSSYLDRFIAIGTSLKNTERQYNMYYQPNDTQRDIIWIDKRDIDQQLTQPNKNGAVAGLQVKASHSWRYVADSISDYHYPVLYFDLNNDWGNLNDYLRGNEIEAKLIYPSDVILYLKDILKGFFYILRDLFNGTITLKWVMEKAKDYNDQFFASGLELSKFDNSNNGLILPNEYCNYGA